ncbi:sigma-70 family RNA polymerase sigma factor [Gloeobacter morelensis]|uniref:Sigma-70 family RNA polymerase sigma factor n=1 Tax=Gloeobacter morelensis MG652769 TaxID=2781736 RepID=A0ABY3PLB7_9CYAN|nr:sigma-70 family RNA polymerase sigma factor [Gloeobacter morelensis]UFP94466.1 sigma-70 family RNA polymerase sigma factor [Gloeobacter morelensis MG652769]
MHPRFFSSPPPTLGQRLHTLAVQLQPVLRRWRQIACDGSVAAAARRALLRDLDKEARQANRAEFLQLVERLCRGYCSRKKVGSHPAFDLELFVEEVKVLALSRLEEFDPAYPFHGWFTSYILLPVYKSLGRSVVVTWENRTPRTEQGRFARWQAQQLLSARSMAGPFYAENHQEEYLAMAEWVPDPKALPEDELLEQHCRERFVEALKSLNESEQTLLTRICLRGELQKEVARSVGLTPGRISQKLKHIYEKLARELGEHFRHDCGQTSFCREWQSADVLLDSAGQSAGCEARLARAIPALVRQSGWGGAIHNRGLPVENVQEQALLDALFDQPAAGAAFDPRGWLLAAAVGVAAVVMVGVGEDRPRPTAPTPTIAQRNRSAPSELSPALKPQALPPAARRAVPPSGASTRPQVHPDGAQRKTPRLPEQLAAAPARPQPPQVPAALPEVLTRELPAADTRQAKAYTERLCASLNAANLLEQPPPGFALLEVVLAVRAGKVELQADSTRAIDPDDAAQETLWREALRRVAGGELPLWPQAVNATVHYYVSLDVDQRKWTCQPVSP